MAQNTHFSSPPTSTTQPLSTGLENSTDVSETKSGSAFSSDIEAGPNQAAMRRSTKVNGTDDIQHSGRSATWPAARTGMGAAAGGNAPKRSATTNTAQGGGALKRWGTALFTPEKKLTHEPTWKASFNATVKASWLNVLLVCIPISWILHFTIEDKQPVVVFVFSLLAIIPLAKLLGFATEELALRVGQTIGGLLNATLGNVVELIVAILALFKCQLQIVQSSLIGSIYSNLLLVLGMSFFVGGYKFSEQSVMATAAQLNTSLLLIAVIAILIPAGYHSVLGMGANGGGLIESSELQVSQILKLSHGVALILLFIYGAYLFFSLSTHVHLYNEDENKHLALTHAQAKEAAANPNLHTELVEHEEEVPQLNVGFAVVLLLVITALVGVTSEWLVDSITGVTETGAISQQWVGLILLPIVGNAAEHVTAVTVSYKDKLDLSMGVAVGSSIQIALFVIPVITLLAWAAGKPLTLLFDPLESIVLFLTVVLVNATVADGKSNWAEGMILMSLYVIIAVTFWFYPSDAVLAASPFNKCT